MAVTLSENWLDVFVGLIVCLHDNTHIKLDETTELSIDQIIHESPQNGQKERILLPYEV